MLKLCWFTNNKEQGHKLAEWWKEKDGDFFSSFEKFSLKEGSKQKHKDKNKGKSQERKIEQVFFQAE